MTIADFDVITWTCGMKAEYQGKVYEIGASDFVERLVGLADAVIGSDDILWVRCENVKLV